MQKKNVTMSWGKENAPVKTYPCTQLSENYCKKLTLVWI